MKRRSISAITAVIFLLSASLLISTGISSEQPVDRGQNPGSVAGSQPCKPSMKPEGEFSILVSVGDTWLEAGKLSFDRFIKGKKIDLLGFLSGAEAAKVRVVQRGGSADNIDAVSLGGVSPQKVEGAGGPLAFKKFEKPDSDLLDTFGKTLEFTFLTEQILAPAGSPQSSVARTALESITTRLPGAEPKVIGPQSSVFKLAARIEPETVSMAPFQFPARNLFRPIDENAAFYTYNLQTTVETHRGRIMNKLDLHKTSALISYAAKSGLL